MVRKKGHSKKSMSKKVKHTRCTAKTKEGKRCKNMSSEKSKCCAGHKKMKAA